MRKQILALALSVAVCGALLSDTALAAEAPSAMDTAISAAGGTGQSTAYKELYPEDAEGTVSFENLESRVRKNFTTLKMLDESIASINEIDFDKMYDDLRKNLNQIARAQHGMMQLNSLPSDNPYYQPLDSYTYGTLSSTYDSLKDTFEDMKDGKVQDDYAAAKRQLENAENQAVIGAESLYMALLELQNTRAGLQRQLEAMDRSVQEMELRYQLEQISALTLQQVKDGRTQLSSAVATLEMNLASYTRQMQMMLGLEQTGVLTLGEVPKVVPGQLSKMDCERDLAAAKEKSYALFAAQRDLEDAKEAYDDTCDQHGHNGYMAKSAAHTLQAAEYTYQSSVENYELNFRAMFAAVADYQQVLEAAESALAYQQKSCDSTALKYQQGTISKNTLLTAQDDLAQAQDAVATAHHNLFTAYHTYLWAVEYGILN